MVQNTRFWTKTLSNPYAPEGTGRLSLLSLLLLGGIAGVLHIYLKYPLGIPGRHGLEWMALLLFGRCLSNNRYAATILAGGAAGSYLIQISLLAPGYGIKPALVFLLTGACADLLFRFSKDRLPMIINAGLIGGLAFVTKPLVMFCLFLTGIKFDSFVRNPDFLPFVSHFLFGLVGGVGGGLAARAARMKRKPD